MKANKNKNGQIVVGIPKEWYRKDTHDQLTEGYDKHFTEEDYNYDGWKGVVYPTIRENQKQGAIYFDEENDNYTYYVINKSQEEIQSEKLSISTSNREQKIKEASDAMIVAELMNETDIETILGNLDIYPMWEAGLHVLSKTDSPNGIPDRYKAFNTDNELTLYEIVLSHTTQSDWPPKDTPNLFKVVAPDGVIPVWVQPTAAHDAYNIGDQVTYNGQTWESKIAGNTTVPDGDVPYNRFWKPIN